MARVRNLPKGSKNHRAKLHESMLASIRTSIELGIKDSYIAKSFGVTRKAIYDIRTGKTWRHVD